MDPLPTTSQVNNRILTVRGQKVILDFDLARLYGVPVKRLNEQLNRNRKKFPADFAFQLSFVEWGALRSQLAVAPAQVSDKQENLSNWSQIATSSRLNRGTAYRPWAFTEHGALQHQQTFFNPAFDCVLYGNAGATHPLYYRSHGWFILFAVCI